MLRLSRLLSMYDKLMLSNFRLVLVQINEAHSDKWPIGLKDHPTVQQSLACRINRAYAFKLQYNVRYPIFIDTWDDLFENTYHAWPDKYHIITDDKTLTAKATYNLDALVERDYSDILLEALRE